MTSLILKDMLIPVTHLIKENVNFLTELDSITGDGDHGVTMAKIATKIYETISVISGEEDSGSLLDDLSWDLMNINGGSAGPLWGAFFEGMATGAKKSHTTREEFIANILIDGYENFSEVSGAKVGDKTMMDAIKPATDSIRQSTDLELMAVSAEEGAEDTVSMIAKFGRARSLKEKSIGHKDPGAVSFSLFYRGIAIGLKQ